MHIVRTLARVLSTALFRFCVLLFPLLAALFVMFHEPSFIQNTFRESGVYGSVVGSVLEESAKQADQDNNPQAQNLLKDEGVRKVANDSITPATLETTFVAVTDGLYDWLKGKTDEPKFRVDLTDTKNALVTNLSAYAENRAANLPVCTLAELQTLSTQPQPDILNLTCLPPGTSVKQLSQEFSSDVTDDVDFLKDPVITEDTLRNDETNEKISDNLGAAPDIYNVVAVLPWVISGVMVASALAVVFLHTKRRRGIQSVGMTLLATGLLLLVITGLYFLFFRDAGKSFVQGGTPEDMRTPIANIVNNIFASYAKITGVIAVIYTLIGSVMIVTELKTREKTTIQPPKTPETPHSTELPTVEKAEKEKAHPKIVS